MPFFLVSVIITMNMNIPRAVLYFGTIYGVAVTVMAFRLITSPFSMQRLGIFNSSCIFEVHIRVLGIQTVSKFSIKLQAVISVCGQIPQVNKTITVEWEVRP